MKIEINGNLFKKICNLYNEVSDFGSVEVQLDKAELQQIRSALMFSEAQDKILDSLLFGEEELV